MPGRQTRLGGMNQTCRVGVNHAKRRSPDRPPRKRPPPHLERLTGSAEQIRFDPLAAPQDKEQMKHRDDDWNHRDVAPGGDVLGTHGVRVLTGIRPQRAFNRWTLGTIKQSSRAGRLTRRI